MHDVCLCHLRTNMSKAVGNDDWIMTWQHLAQPSLHIITHETHFLNSMQNHWAIWSKIPVLKFSFWSLLVQPVGINMFYKDHSCTRYLQKHLELYSCIIPNYGKSFLHLPQKSLFNNNSSTIPCNLFLPVACLAHGGFLFPEPNWDAMIQNKW